jgi:hypothetical protein
MEQENLKVRLPKLARQGENWVTYRDRLFWALRSQSLTVHTQSPTPTEAYIDLGEQNGLEPKARWQKEEDTIMVTLQATLPDTVFTKVKGGANVHEVWDSLKLQRVKRLQKGSSL